MAISRSNDDQPTPSQVTQQAPSSSVTTIVADRAIGRTSSKKVVSIPKTPSSMKCSVNPAPVEPTYVSVLSSTPAPVNTQNDVTEHREASPPVNEPESDTDLNDPVAVWKTALKLASKERVEEAAMYFKLHARLTSTNQSLRETSATVTPELNTTNTSQATKTPQLVTEGGLTFIPGAVTSHTDIGFTPYFDRNLKELKGPLPLTIFNKQWQDLANSYHVEKRVKTDNINKDLTTYTGYPYPHEMTQSYSVWNVNYRNFVATLRDVYKFKLFATWAEAHQSNVEFYHARDNWMTAFRYDVKIRMNAFAFRVSEGGVSAPPDISQRREDVAAICFAEARRLNEGSFTDNPYAKGGVRSGYDWTTGLPRTNAVGTSGSQNHYSAHLLSSDNNQISQTNQRQARTTSDRTVAARARTTVRDLREATMGRILIPIMRLREQQQLLRDRRPVEEARKAPLHSLLDFYLIIHSSHFLHAPSVVRVRIDITSICLSLRLTAVFDICLTDYYLNIR